MEPLWPQMGPTVQWPVLSNNNILFAQGCGQEKIFRLSKIEVLSTFFLQGPVISKDQQ